MKREAKNEGVRWRTGLTSAAIVLMGFGGVAHPAAAQVPDPPSSVMATFVAPLDGAVRVTSPEFAWTSIEGATAYRLTVGSSAGATDVFDSSEVTVTAMTVTGLPSDRPLYASVWTLLDGTWAHSWITFTRQHAVAAATMVTPTNGADNVSLAVPFQWTATPLAGAYRLQIGTSEGADDLLDTGPIRVTRRFVHGLPSGSVLYGRLSTLLGDAWQAEIFAFTVGSTSVPAAVQIEHALSMTAQVRDMADPSHAPFGLTLLKAVANGREYAFCTEYASALAELLQQTGVTLPSRVRNTCLYWNSYECHTLIELLVTETQAYLLDPTFALAVRDRDTGTWVSVDELSEALRSDSLDSLEFVGLSPRGDAYANGYYLDYPLLFLNPDSAEVRRSPLPYLQEVPLPVSVESGVFLLKCPDGSATGEVIFLGQLTSAGCTGEDNLSYMFWGRDLDDASTPLAAAVLSPRWYVFAHDTDHDALPDVWEEAHGLDRFSAVGGDGASGDPDGDGVTNADEYAAGTNPVDVYSRYLAEGATSSFFETQISLANPSTAAADAVIRFMRSDGQVVTHAVSVPAMSSRHVTVNDVPGMAEAEFSTVVESRVPLLVDRLMSWDRASRYGSHLGTSMPDPSSQWYLAEGATHSGFSLFYLVQNPGTDTSHVRVRYLVPSGPPIVRDYAVAAQTRFNIWVNLVPGLAGTDVSAELTVIDGPDVLVERAMYLTQDGQLFAAGHESPGITAESTRWTLPGGSIGDRFQTFVLLANPSTQTAEVNATFLFEDGRTVQRSYRVAPESRFNIWLNAEGLLGPSVVTGSVPVATVVESTNFVPFVAERAMWWPGTDPARWIEAHGSPGAVEAAIGWGFAAGEVGLSEGDETVISLTNDTTTTASVRVTLLFADGTAPAVRDFTVDATRRFDVPVRTAFPEAAGRRFGATVESIGPDAPAIVVERAIYWDVDGVALAAGGDSLASVLP